MASKEDGFNERREYNPAELKCQEFFEKRKDQYHIIRYGLDQLHNKEIDKDWYKIPIFIAYTPDFLIINNRDIEYFNIYRDGELIDDSVNEFYYIDEF